MMASNNSANSSRKRRSSQPSIMDAFKRPKRVEPTQSTESRSQKSSKEPQNSTQNSKSTSNNTTSSSTRTLQIIESTGDIFSAPSNTLLIHACNCQGSWSAGIAKAFKQNYPKAFPKYASHCKDLTPAQLFSSALLITPPDSAFDDSVSTAKAKKQSAEGLEQDADGHLGDEEDDGNASESLPGDPATHSVGCLFTSHHYGRRKDSPAKILEATKPAMQHLLRQVEAYNAMVNEGRRIKEVRMCQINSGLFNVPWEKTKKALEGVDVRGFEIKVVKVVSREE